MEGLNWNFVRWSRGNKQRLCSAPQQATAGFHLGVPEICNLVGHATLRFDSSVSIFAKAPTGRVALSDKVLIK